MKKFLSHIIFCSLVLLTVSCLNRKPPEPVTITNTKTIREVVKDTVYQVEADSSFYQAYIECINGKPVLIGRSQDKSKNPVSKPGKNLKAPNVNLKGNQLNVDCYSEAHQLFKQWREKYESEHQAEIKTEYVEKPFKWYDKALMWFGIISAVFCFLFLFIINKFYNPFK